MRSPSIVACILLASALPIPAAAQSRDLLHVTALDLSTADPGPVSGHALPQAVSFQESPEGRSAPALVAGGLAGGAVGVVAGFYIGALLASDDDNDDLDFLSGGVAGAAIGEGLLLPLGVHLANRPSGSYATSALFSLGLAAAGLLALEAVHYDRPGAPIVLVAIPVAQIATSIAVERATD